MISPTVLRVETSRMEAKDGRAKRSPLADMRRNSDAYIFAVYSMLGWDGKGEDERNAQLPGDFPHRSIEELGIHHPPQRTGYEERRQQRSVRPKRILKNLAEPAREELHGHTRSLL